MIAQLPMPQGQQTAAVQEEPNFSCLVPSNTWPVLMCCSQGTVSCGLMGAGLRIQKILTAFCSLYDYLAFKKVQVLFKKHSDNTWHLSCVFFCSSPLYLFYALLVYGLDSLFTALVLQSRCTCILLGSNYFISHLTVSQIR